MESSSGSGGVSCDVYIYELTAVTVDGGYIYAVHRVYMVWNVCAVYIYVHPMGIYTPYGYIYSYGAC